MARGDSIYRHWNLLKMLQTRGDGIPLKEIADELEVSERTIQRDFEVLQELGFPVDHTEDVTGKRYWRIPHDFFKTGPLLLSLTQAVSLHLAEQLLTPFAGTHFANGLKEALHDIRRVIPEKALGYFAGLDEIHHVRSRGNTDYAAHADTIRLVAEAAQQNRSVELRYRSPWSGNEAYTTRFDPYGLVYYEGDLYTVGHSHRAGEVRVLKATRILDMTPTSDRFEKPAGFSLEVQFQHSFGIVQSTGDPVDIEVRFTGPATALITERNWHESQTIAWSSKAGTALDCDASSQRTLIATFRLDNVIEFKRWIKSFGDAAEVLTPAWLRKEMQKELQSAARQYDSNPIQPVACAASQSAGI